MLYQCSAQELSDRFVQGQITASQIAAYFLERIQHLDEDVGAFLQVFADRVMEKAEQLDVKRSSGEPLGKLAGIPVAIKDNLHVFGEITTCASKMLANYKAPFSATVVDLIEKEDGLIIGKTNLDEFAMGSGNEYSAFQSTRNPWNLSKTPGGSSGGSAAATSARFAPLSLGSDTGGSIRLPASFTGTVGFKPSYGRVSRFGLIEFASSLDQIGPFANSVSDIALMMEVLGNPCEKDATSLPFPGENYLDALSLPIRGKKVGIPKEIFDRLPQKSRSSFDQVVEKIALLGVDVVEVSLSLLDCFIPTYYVLMSAEASTNLARFDGVKYGRRSEKADSLDELYDFSRQEGFGREVKQRILLGTFVLSSGYQQAYYQKAQQIRTLILREYKKAFSFCDAIITPTSVGAPFDLGEIRDPVAMYLQDLYTVGANLGGLPAMSLPTGLDEEGLPQSIQLIAPHFAEKSILHLAYQIERELDLGLLVPPLFDKEFSL